MKAATEAALAAVGLSEASAASGGSTPGSAAAEQAPGAEAGVTGTGETQRQSSTDGRDGAPPEPGSFDLGLVNSWSSAATQGPASDADGDGSSSPAAEKSDSSEAVGQACAAEDVVLQVPGGATGSGLYDLD